MRLEGRKCSFKTCKTRILSNAVFLGNEPKWMVKGTMKGYCMECSLREYSNLIPVVNAHPDDKFEFWAMINGELTPLVPKEEEE